MPKKQTLTEQLQDKLTKCLKENQKLKFMFKRDRAKLSRLEFLLREKQREITVLKQQKAVLQKENKKRSEDW